MNPFDKIMLREALMPLTETVHIIQKQYNHNNNNNKNQSEQNHLGTNLI